MNLISELTTDSDSARIRLDPDFEKAYLRGPFEIAFSADSPGPCVADKSKILIPLLANIAPIVWLANLEARVPELDMAYSEALAEIRNVFKRMYPALEWRGNIVADKLTQAVSAGRSRDAALLFSGGVDSVYTSLSLKAKPQLLITVLGSDIANDNTAGWNRVKKQTREFARMHGHESVYIESNFRQFLNVPRLEARWPEITEGWWGGVQHGIGLLGLAAPVVGGSTRMYISATHTEGFDVAWGSNPQLDASCKWGSVAVEHYGYDTPRQEKIRRIVEATRDDAKKPKLRVCYSDRLGDGGNCGWCEKCLRTFAGLLVAGVTPADYGMEVDLALGMARAMKGFSRYRILLGADERFMWEDLQRHAKERAASRPATAGEAGFLSWLEGFDFAEHQRRGQGLQRVKKWLVRMALANPELETIARKFVAARNRMLRKAT